MEKFISSFEQIDPRLETLLENLSALELCKKVEEWYDYLLDLHTNFVEESNTRVVAPPKRDFNKLIEDRQKLQRYAQKLIEWSQYFENKTEIPVNLEVSETEEVSFAQVLTNNLKHTKGNLKNIISVPEIGREQIRALACILSILGSSVALQNEAHADETLSNLNENHLRLGERLTGFYVDLGGGFEVYRSNEYTDPDGNPYKTQLDANGYPTRIIRDQLTALRPEFDIKTGFGFKEGFIEAGYGIYGFRETRKNTDAVDAYDRYNSDPNIPYNLPIQLEDTSEREIFQLRGGYFVIPERLNLKGKVALHRTSNNPIIGDFLDKTSYTSGLGDSVEYEFSPEVYLGEQRRHVIMPFYRATLPLEDELSFTEEENLGVTYTYYPVKKDNLLIGVNIGGTTYNTTYTDVDPETSSNGEIEQSGIKILAGATAQWLPADWIMVYGATHFGTDALTQSSGIGRRDFSEFSVSTGFRVYPQNLFGGKNEENYVDPFDLVQPTYESDIPMTRSMQIDCSDFSDQTILARNGGSAIIDISPEDYDYNEDGTRPILDDTELIINNPEKEKLRIEAYDGPSAWLFNDAGDANKKVIESDNFEIKVEIPNQNRAQTIVITNESPRNIEIQASIECEPIDIFNQGTLAQPINDELLEFDLNGNPTTQKADLSSLCKTGNCPDAAVPIYTFHLIDNEYHKLGTQINVRQDMVTSERNGIYFANLMTEFFNKFIRLNSEFEIEGTGIYNISFFNETILVSLGKTPYEGHTNLRKTPGQINTEIVNFFRDKGYDQEIILAKYGDRSTRTTISN